MKTRLFWCFWYCLFVATGWDFSAVLKAYRPGSALSAVCAGHQCSCTLRGSCDVSCCCAGISDAEDEEHEEGHSLEPAFGTCGSDLPPALAVKMVQPHLRTRDIAFLLPHQPLGSPRRLTYPPRWRASDPPMKIPISTC